MQYFQKIREGLDVKPILNAIMRQPDLWNQFDIRTRLWNDYDPEDLKVAPRSPHSSASDILVRFNDINQDLTAIANDKECINFPAFYRLPQLRSLVFDLMRIVEGEQLGRILITKLRPGAVIAPHTDMGAPADFYQRYHIVLSSSAGCLFRAMDETVQMKTGELWWFDNTVEHEVINNSAEDRIHLIIDVRTFQ